MSNACKKLWLALAALMALAAIAQTGAVLAGGQADGKGASLRQFVLADTGHVELIAPGSAAWSRVTESIDAFFRST